MPGLTLPSQKHGGTTWFPLYQTTTITTAATTDITPVPTTAGQTQCLNDVLISSDTAITLTLQQADTSNGNVVIRHKIYIGANQTIQVTLLNGIYATLADRKFQLITSAAGNVSVLASYHNEA